jgi:hypothetical protein
MYKSREMEHPYRYTNLGGALLKRYKMAAIMVLWFIMVTYGILKVNAVYIQSNKKSIDDSIFAMVEDKDKNLNLSYSALYGEINISRGEDNKLAVYFNYKPFDIRFGLGNKVFFINSTVFTNLKNKIDGFIN